MTAYAGTADPNYQAIHDSIHQIESWLHSIPVSLSHSAHAHSKELDALHQHILSALALDPTQPSGDQGIRSFNQADSRTQSITQELTKLDPQFTAYKTLVTECLIMRREHRFKQARVLFTDKAIDVYEQLQKAYKPSQASNEVTIAIGLPQDLKNQFTPLLTKLRDLPEAQPPVKKPIRGRLVVEIGLIAFILGCAAGITLSDSTDIRTFIKNAFKKATRKILVRIKPSSPFQYQAWMKEFQTLAQALNTLRTKDYQHIQMLSKQDHAINECFKSIYNQADKYPSIQRPIHTLEELHTGSQQIAHGLLQSLKHKDEACNAILEATLNLYDAIEKEKETRAA